MSSTGDDRRRAGNLVGYDVEAIDGPIGTVDEASNIASQAHLVVETGFWFSGRRRMIPAGVLRSVDAERGKVYVGLTKKEITSAPDFDAQLRHDRSDYNTFDDPFWP